MRRFLSNRNVSENLSRELMLDTYLFQNFTRMSKQDFEFLVQTIGHRIARTNTNMRENVPITTRLAITLRFLATGDSYRSLMYLFKVHYSTISLLVQEVCSALIEGLKDFIRGISNFMFMILFFLVVNLELAEIYKTKELHTYITI